MASPRSIRIDPTPTFSLSPWLYMQFMEPLGTTDGSVEAMWDHQNNDWKPDTIRVTRELGPTLLRWGGCLSSYYRWREGVGPRSTRKPMHNLLWRGMETNQIGTHEFVDFARRVGAEPFYCVNFESDGRMHWAHPTQGGLRSAGPREAAEWVDYCNNPSNRERRRNGAKEPFNLKLWQLGNETSYDKNGFDCTTAARRTIAFARAMRKVDPDLTFIGWGDSGWAPEMLDTAGQHLDYISFHAGYGSTLKGKPPFADHLFRRDPAETWEHLMTGAASGEAKVLKFREQLKGREKPIAVTEGHYGRYGGQGEMMSSWAAGVAYARIFNMYQRHGDAIKILTVSDFCGTRWMCNSVMIVPPGDTCYMLPVARVMQLFRHHHGRRAVTVTSGPSDLDITASRTGRKVWLHIANTQRTRSVTTRVAIDGCKVVSGKAHYIDVDPSLEAYLVTDKEFEPKSKALPRNGSLTVPAASVMAVELVVKEVAG